MTPELKTLTELKFQSDCSKTKLPTYAVPKDKFTDKTSNGLTKCVITWIKLHGGQAERINTMGRMIDKRVRVTNVVGQEYTIGSMSYIPTTGTKGSADVSATINGKSVKFEIKIGKDRQSPAQIKYQQDVEAAGGLYFIVKDFATFLEQFKKIQKTALRQSCSTD